MASPVSRLREAVVELSAAYRRRSSDHSTLAELKAYHAGDLGDSKMERVAEHLSFCEDCRILLLYVVIPPAGKTEREEKGLDKAWQRFRAQLPVPSPDGRSLASLLGGKPLSALESLRLGCSIARSLHRYHSKGQLIQGFGAEEVRLDPEGEVQAIHHRFASIDRILEAEGGSNAEQLIVELLSGASPEQIGGHDLDQRSDLFSLGALLYRMTTGVSPFYDQTPLEVASRVISLNPVPPREINPAVDSEFSDLIQQLLAKEPVDRPRSAAQVLWILESIRSRLTDHGDRQTQHQDAEMEIENLYEEITVLTQECAETSDLQKETRLKRTYDRLLQLQKAQAARYRQWFEESLEMPIDAGKSILARAEALKKKLEDLTSADPPAEDSDSTQTQAGPG